MSMTPLRFVAALVSLLLAAPPSNAAEDPAAESETAREVSACMKGVPAGLAPHWRAICEGEKRNLVLGHMHGGMAALAAEQLELAERSFDTALDGIETIFAETPEAEKARSVWHAESVKDFKGEPFERMMAYYYRGLLYLARGDWDNAQASFQGGILQDTFAEQRRHQADVGLLVWLQGWANSCRGNTLRAGELFDEARAINPQLKPPAPGQTLLVLAETGQGPAKFAMGPQGSKLGIRERFVGNTSLVAKVGDRTATMTRAEDLFYQATTRGGRAADTILAEKASAKAATETFGNVALAAGLTTMAYSRHSHDSNRQNNNAAALGAAIVLIALLAHAAAQSMETETDTRTWLSLPHSVHHLVMEAPAGQPAESLDLLDPAGRSVLGQRDILQAVHDGCSLVWVGAHSVTPSLAVAPAAGESGAGNCRTTTGALAMMEPGTCQRIGGTPLGVQ